MKHHRLSFYVSLVVLALLATAFTLQERPPSWASPARPSAGRQVQTAWQTARRLGAYDYSTTIVQTTWPLPRLENIGLSSSQQRIYLQGTADLPAETLHMKLWSDGGSAHTGQDALELKVENGQAVGRVSSGDWQEVDDFSGLFAPNQDLLSYLAAAENLREVAEGEPGAQSAIRKYAFDVDGPAFAAYMRDQLEAELVRTGKLPVGVNLGVAQQYAGMSGQGEIWLTAAGLPLRQLVHLQFPPAHLERVEVDITSDFSGWRETPAQSPAWLGFIANPGRHLTPRALGQAGLSLSLAASLLGLLGLAIMHRKSPLVYAAVALTVIASMLLTPLLQSQQVYAFAQEQRAQQSQVEADRAAREQVREIQIELAKKDFDPHKAPLKNQQTGSSLSPHTRDLSISSSLSDLSISPSLSDLSISSADSDGDGLDDQTETMELGTNPDQADSDGDGIGDRIEVQGFQALDGKWWYLNPLDLDTNGDGQSDGLECANLKDGTATYCEDTDGDRTPDAFDFDDDNDGVPDTVDLAPALAVGGGATGNGVQGLAGQSLALNVSQLVTGTPVFVDFQLRPTNPTHLWYTLNVLDWPDNDREGQQRRVFTDTFGASGKEANGDMRLSPMLEVLIPAQDGFGGLPVKAGVTSRPALPSLAGLNTVSQTQRLNTWLASWLDRAETDKYGLSIRVKDGTGALLAYVPLNLVRDATGDSPVAFSARMAYRPKAASLGQDQTVRLVWLIQGKQDTCTPVPDDFEPNKPSAERYDAWCQDAAHWSTAEGVIHRYYDDWYLTGLSVREDRGVEVGVIFEPPSYPQRNPDYEESLWQLADGLERTFLAGRTNVDGQRDLTLNTLAQRFALASTATSDERWGIPLGATDVRTYSFSDQSGLATIPMTHTPQLLQSVFTSGSTALVESPSLLFVREERYRSAGLDTPAIVQAGAGSSTTQGVLAASRLTLDMAQAAEQVLAGMNWAPYRYQAGSWQAYPIGEYWEHLDAILARYFQNQYPAERPELNAGRVLLARAYYLTNFHGAASLVELDGQAPGRPAAEDNAVTTDYRQVRGAAGVVRWLTRRGVDNVLSLRQVSSETTATEELLAFFGSAEKNVSSNYESSFMQFVKANWKALAVGALVLAGTVTVLLVTGQASGTHVAEYALLSVSLVFAVKAATDAVDIYNAFSKMAAASVNILKSAAATAAMVGMVVMVAAAVGLFLAQVIVGGVRFGSLAFNQFFAEMVANLIVAGLMFAVGAIVPVGTLIVAIVGLIDAVIVLVCKAAGAEEREDLTDPVFGMNPCQGIAGVLAKLVQYLIYSQNPIVDVNRADRMAISDFEPLVEAEAGFQVGSWLGGKLRVTNTLYRNTPKSALAWTYAWHWTDDDYVKQSDFDYRLVAKGQPVTWHLSTANTHDYWQPATGGGIVTMNKDLDNPRVVQLVQAGINVASKIELVEGYKINAQECFLLFPWYVPVCYLRDEADEVRTPLGETLVFDVFPSTLDGFYALAERGNNSYSLAWDSRFPTLCDADGDSLRSQACGGNDPDDGTADSDGDGLSDLYEVRNGSLPLDSDSDGDGLGDYQEVFYRTNPLQADTDGDGLDDQEEVDGWSFVYGFDASNQPLQTWVRPDPLDPDTDGDGILDKLEQVYGFNPRVASALDVLRITSQAQEMQAGGLAPSDGYVVPGQTVYYTATIENPLRNRHALGLLEVELPVAVQNQSLEPVVYTLAPKQKETLKGQVTVRGDAASQAVSLTNRAGAIIADLWGEAGGRSLWMYLDENPGATSFADRSQQARPGTCITVTCPTAGVDGYVGQAVRFDGVDDALELGTAEQLGLKDSSFSVAAWVNGDVFGSGDRTILGMDSGGENRQLHLVVRNGKPHMGFYANDTPGNTTLSAGRWYHLVWRYDQGSGEQAIFVDGVLDAASAGHPAFEGSGLVKLGRWLEANYFDGMIDEVEIYPRALSDDEIAARFKEPVLHLTLDGSYADASAYRQNVTCNPTYRRWWESPIESGCPQIDAGGGVLGGKAAFSQADFTPEGDSKVLQMPLNDSLDVSDGHFSQAFWIYPQDGIVRYDTGDLLPYRYGIMGSNDETANAYPTVRMLSPSGDGKPEAGSPLRKLEVGFGDGSQWRSLVTGFVLTKERWNHVVVSYDSTPGQPFGTYRVYVDGALKETRTISGTPASVQPNTTLYVGRSASPRWIKLHDDTDWNEGRMDYALDQDDLRYKSQGLTREWDNYDDWAASADVWNTYAYLWEHANYEGELYHLAGAMTTLGGFCDRASSLRLGSHSIPMHGMLDDVRIYRYTLSGDEVQDLYESTTRPLELRFDDAPASTRLRNTFNGDLAGSCSGAACPDTGLPGRANQAARFDGVDDYVVIPQVTDVSDNVSLAAWVNWAGPGGGYQFIVYNGNSASSGYGILAEPDGRLTILNGGVAWVTSTTQLAVGAWQHVAAVRDSGAWKLYLDGNQVPSFGNPTPNPPAGRTTVGSNNAGGENFHGLLDHVTLHRRALSQADVVALMNEAPVLNLHLDEGLGATTFIDSSQLGNNAVCNTSVIPPICPQAGVKGQMRGAASFDFGDHVTVPYNPALDLDTFSISLWVKPTQTSGSGSYQALLAKEQQYSGWPGQNYMLVIGWGSKVGFQATHQDPGLSCSGILFNLLSSNPLNAHQWNHILATYDGQKAILYLNGSPDTTFELPSGEPGTHICKTDGPITIGRTRHDSSYGNFTGQLDEIAIYNKALTRRDASDLYEYQVSWFDTTDSHNLVVDAEAPTARLDYALSYIRPVQGQVMAISAADASSDVALVEYRITGSGYAGEWQPATRDEAAWTFAITTITGTYTIDVRATDRVGNVSTVSSSAFRKGESALGQSLDVDGVPPDIWLDSHLTQAVLPAPNRALTLTGVVTDNASGAGSAHAALFDDTGASVGGTQAAQLLSGADVQLPPGAVLHLPFDEPAGAVQFSDVSGHNLDVTCPGGASSCPAAGQDGWVGKAVRFDGNDYVEIPYTATLNSASFSVSAWARVMGGSGGYRSVLTSRDGDPLSGYILYVTPDDTWEFWVGNGAGWVAIGHAPVTQRTWTHLLASYDVVSQTMNFYVSGQLVGSQADVAFAPNTQRPLRIGAGVTEEASPKAYFYGLIDDVRVYDRALSGEEVQQELPQHPAGTWRTIHTLPLEPNGTYTVRLAAQDTLGNAITTTAGPLRLDGTAPFADVTSTGVYTLSGTGAGRPVITGTVGETPYPANPALRMHWEEAAGADRFYDGSANRLVATCSASACPEAGQGGWAGWAIHFDGVDDSARLSNADGQFDTPQLTAAAWVKPEWIAGQPSGNPAMMGLPGRVSVHIRSDYGGLYAWQPAGGVSYPYSFQPDNWYHVAVSWDGSTERAYVNGQLIGATPGRSLGGATKQDLSIGSAGGAQDFYHGLVDEVALYNWALTAGQIHAIANPVSSGVSQVEIGFLHAQYRNTPGVIAWDVVELAQPNQAFSTWRYVLPEGLEGPYQVYLRTRDGLSNTRTLPNAWEGEIDTRAPLITFTQSAMIQGQRLVTCQAEDYNLVETSCDCPVAPAAWQRAYQQAAWYADIYTNTAPKLASIEASALVTVTAGTLTACDLFDNCTTVPVVSSPPQARTSLILAPAAHSAWAVAPISLTGYIETPGYLRALTLTVNGAPISTTTWPAGAVTATVWMAAWTPSGEGKYTLQADLLDWDGNVSASQAGHVIYVDTTPPALQLTTAYINGQNWLPSGYLKLEGLVTETVQLARLEARVETPPTRSRSRQAFRLPSSPSLAETWQAIGLPSGPTWRGSVYAGSAVRPDGDSFTLTVRAVDMAGFTTQVSRVLPADAVPPAPVSATLAYTDSTGARTALAPGATVYDVLSPSLLIDWTAASDRSGIAGYRVGWTASPTLTAGQVASLSLYAAAGSHAQSVGEARKLYAHVIAQDTFGNQTVQAFGPVYADYSHTPDFLDLTGFGDLSGLYRGWMNSGCTLLGVDRRANQAAPSLNPVQKFYATWDDTALRLAWTGADWDRDGDLFIYLSAPGISTTTAYNPFTPIRPITLPTPANSLIWVQDSQTASLMHWDDGAHSWQVITAGLSYRFDAPYTDLAVPFAELGIADPANTVLGLLALAADEGQMLFWATAPARNVVNSARVADNVQAALRTGGTYGNPTRAYALQLGAGACPGSEVFSEAKVDLLFSAVPAGAQVVTYDDGWFSSSGDILRLSIGDGERAAYRLELANVGQAIASNVSVAITASELRLDNAPTPVGDFLWRDTLNLGDIAPGERKTATFGGTVAFNVGNTAEISGFVGVDASLSFDRSAYVGEPIRTRSVQHRIDYAPPSYVGISQPRTLLGLGVNPVKGVVHDESAVPTVTLQAQLPSGGLSTFDCPGASATDGAWSCAWDVGTGAANDDVFNLRARATDRLGQLSSWSRWLTLTLDTQPVTLSLDATTESALGDGWLAAGETSLSGQVLDNRLASEVTACQPDGQACRRAEFGLDTQTLSQTVYVYDDAPAAPISIGAANACVGGELIVRSFVVSDSFPVAGVKLGLNADLAYRNTLAATMASPSGKQVTLHYPLGYPGQNLDVLWDNAAWNSLFGEESSHNTAAPYYENARRPDQDIDQLAGEDAQGVWRLTLCDHFSLATDNGLYKRSRLILSVDRLPADTRGWWRYSLPEVAGQDGVSRTVELYGLDSVGNRSTALSLTFQVDTVPPVISYLTHTTTLRPGYPFLMAGSVSDGGGVRSMQVSGLTPGQGYVAGMMSLEYDSGRNSATWSYTDTSQFTQPGDYSLWVEAIDDAGNRSTFGPLAVEVLAPRRLDKSVTPAQDVGLGSLVTYTLVMYNDHHEAIPSVTITDPLPAAVTPLEVVQGPAFVLSPTQLMAWPPFSMTAYSTQMLQFTARVTTDTAYFGASVANTAYFSSESASGASSQASLSIEPAIRILSPQAGQVLSATNDISVTLAITIDTSLTLPGEGYWQLAIDGRAVISPVLAYAATAPLELGGHVISATLYTPDHQALGADAVEVTVVSTWRRIYLPLVLRSAGTR